MLGGSKEEQVVLSLEGWMSEWLANSETKMQCPVRGDEPKQGQGPNPLPSTPGSAAPVTTVLE